MPLQKITFRPGVHRDSTPYAAEGYWYDCDKIRFRSGYPEKIGGWSKHSVDMFVGTCRKLVYWSTLASQNLIGIGTHLKFYIEYGGDIYDVTPIRRTVVLGTDPLATTSGSATITVTDSGHGAVENDYVTLSGISGAVNGIPDTELNVEHQILTTTTNTYTIAVTTLASGTGSGGGAAVSAAYQINTGADTYADGDGWGAGAFGEGPWGGPASTTVAGGQLRLWSCDPFGEDLVFCPMDGGLYYWDATNGLSTRGVNFTALSGASDAPTIARFVMVSQTDRHVIAFGANTLGSATQDSMLIRWSDTEDAADWTPTEENAAGDFRLSQGSEIVAVERTRQEILIWTDSALYSMQYVGGQFVFGVQMMAENVNIMAPNSAIVAGDVTYWMGRRDFYAYSGRVETVPCTVREYVFGDINFEQRYKFFAGVNNKYGEVWWFYCSSDSSEIDRYVIYSTTEKAWSFGTMERTAWIDNLPNGFPMAAGTDGYLYEHESGLDDGSENPPTSISAYVESCDFDLGDGDKMMFLRRVLPDLTFKNSTSTDPAVTYTLKRKYTPGSATVTDKTGTVTRTESSPEEYTQQLYLRMRGRQTRLRVSSDQIGTEWRVGDTRLELQPDGERE